GLGDLLDGHRGRIAGVVLVETAPVSRKRRDGVVDEEEELSRLAGGEARLRPIENVLVRAALADARDGREPVGAPDAAERRGEPQGPGTAGRDRRPAVDASG